jgi:YihY family inner membrane protein
VTNPFEAAGHWLDRVQQRYRTTAFVVGVIKRYGDDRGGQLSALITFYGFLAVFPLLLLFFTVVAITLAAHPKLQEEVIKAALNQFPILGADLSKNIHALSNRSVTVFVVTFLGLLWGGLGIANALQSATHQIWRVPREEEPALQVRVARSLLILGVLALTILVSSILAAVAQVGFASFHHQAWVTIVSLLASAAVNVGGYLLAFVVLSPKGTPRRDLWPGALVGGIGWTALQSLATFLLTRHLTRASALYGVFAVVLGLVFWINLGTQLFLYASEINVVRRERLWPRSFFDGPAGELRVVED